MKKYIYTISVFHFYGKNNTGKYSHRVWGWCPNFDEANQALKKHPDSMFESGHYTLAVIEKMCKGAYSISSKEWWYKSEYKNGSCTVRKCKKPQAFKNIVHFSMG